LFFSLAICISIAENKKALRSPNPNSLGFWGVLKSPLRRLDLWEQSPFRRDWLREVELVSMQKSGLFEYLLKEGGDNCICMQVDTPILFYHANSKKKKQ